MAQKAPFPWFGGKSRCAAQVWQALGDVRNYVEPFAGSLAVLLARPTPPDVEVVNDLDCFVANFWRAAQRAPSEVAKHADWPASEVEIVARHRWLMERKKGLERLRLDADFFDAEVAGVWLWGVCVTIGDVWLRQKSMSAALPSTSLSGVHSKRVRTEGIVTAMDELSRRIRYVKIACGDWKRVLSESILFTKSSAGVLLDPPYYEGNMRYAEGDTSISASVREWALEHGDDPRLRIVLCGYEGEHKMPESWRVISRIENGGYGNQSGNVNKKRERLWLSPHCLPVGDQSSSGNGVLIGGRLERIPGLRCTSPLARPDLALKLGEDGAS